MLITLLFAIGIVWIGLSLSSYLRSPHQDGLSTILGVVFTVGIGVFTLITEAKKNVDQQNENSLAKFVTRILLKPISVLALVFSILLAGMSTKSISSNTSMSSNALKLLAVLYLLFALVLYWWPRVQEELLKNTAGWAKLFHGFFGPGALLGLSVLSIIGVIDVLFLELQFPTPTPGPIPTSVPTPIPEPTPTMPTVTVTAIPPFPFPKVFPDAKESNPKIYVKSYDAGAEIGIASPDKSENGCDGQSTQQVIIIDYTFTGDNQAAALIVDWSQAPKPTTFDVYGKPYFLLDVGEVPEFDILSIRLADGTVTHDSTPNIPRSEGYTRLDNGRYKIKFPVSLYKSFIQSRQLEILELHLSSHGLGRAGVPYPYKNSLCIQSIRFGDINPPEPTDTPVPSTNTPVPLPTNTPVPVPTHTEEPSTAPPVSPVP